MQRVSLLGLCSPLVATAVGWLSLGQSLTAVQLAGAVLVLAALRIGQRTTSGRPLSRRPLAVVPAPVPAPSP